MSAVFVRIETSDPQMDSEVSEAVDFTKEPAIDAFRRLFNHAVIEWARSLGGSNASQARALGVSERWYYKLCERIERDRGRGIAASEGPALETPAPSLEAAR